MQQPNNSLSDYLISFFPMAQGGLPHYLVTLLLLSNFKAKTEPVCGGVAQPVGAQNSNRKVANSKSTQGITRCCVRGKNT